MCFPQISHNLSKKQVFPLFLSVKNLIFEKVILSDFPALNSCARNCLFTVGDSRQERVKTGNYCAMNL